MSVEQIHRIFSNYISNYSKNKPFISRSIHSTNFHDLSSVDGVIRQFRDLPHFRKMRVYKFKVDYINIDLEIAGFLGNHSNSAPKIEDIIVFYVQFLVHFCTRFSNKDITDLHIRIFLFNGSKRFPSQSTTELTSMNVNSGYTQYYEHSPKRTIVVYRSEEVLKVFTHEMIHAFGLDDKMINDPNSFFARTFNISNNKAAGCLSLNINESFTDAFACYFNAVIYSHLSRESFQKVMKKERDHIIKQGVKVLYYLKHSQIAHTICESANVTAYYILKAIIYMKLEPFIEMLEINKCNIQVDRYVDILRENLQDFLKYYTYQTTHNNQRITRISMDRLVNRSLKMSSLDILTIPLSNYVAYFA